MAAREPPIVLEPVQQTGDKRAAIIFIHGLGDDAAGVENVGQQLQKQHIVPNAKWIFPNATDNLDAMMRAWFTPTPLSPFPSQRPELDDPEDEEGLLKSMDYVVSIIDELVAEGISLDRIVVAGFSQGCAMSLLTGMLSRHTGSIAGIMGIAGFFPLADRIVDLRRDRGLPEKASNVPVFLTRGTRDVLVPRRFFSGSQRTLQELGVSEESIEAHEYEGAGHTITGSILRDMGGWLQKVLA